jgi:hypothetical protein
MDENEILDSLDTARFEPPAIATAPRRISA